MVQDQESKKEGMDNENTLRKQYEALKAENEKVIAGELF
jgi:hypothetical protein